MQRAKCWPYVLDRCLLLLSGSGLVLVSLLVKTDDLKEKLLLIFFLLCEFEDWLKLTQQQELLAELALLLAEVCQFLQYLVSCVSASAACIPCSCLDRGRIPALRSLSSEHSLPCPALVMLPIVNHSSQPALCSSSCSYGHRDTLTMVFTPRLLLSDSTANTVSGLPYAVFRC